MSKVADLNIFYNMAQKTIIFVSHNMKAGGHWLELSPPYSLVVGERLSPPSSNLFSVDRGAVAWIGRTSLKSHIQL